MSIEDVYGQEYSEEDMNNFSKLREESYDFNLIRKHELAETQDGSVVYRRASGEIVDWAEATNLRGEELLDEVEEKKQEITDMISDLSVYVDNAKDSVDNSVEEAQSSLDTVVEDARQALVAVQQAEEQIEDMIDVEKITDGEIDTIVEGGE